MAGMAIHGCGVPDRCGDQMAAWIGTEGSNLADSDSVTAGSGFGCGSADPFSLIMRAYFSAVVSCTRGAVAAFLIDLNAAGSKTRDD
jgi:hypothetical protein